MRLYKSRPLINLNLRYSNWNELLLDHVTPVCSSVYANLNKYNLLVVSRVRGKNSCQKNGYALSHSMPSFASMSSYIAWDYRKNHRLYIATEASAEGQYHEPLIGRSLIWQINQYPVLRAPFQNEQDDLSCHRVLPWVAIRVLFCLGVGLVWCWCQ